MAKFIEVTFYNEDKATMINANDIYRIEANQTYGCSLYVKTTLHGRDHLIVVVKESYQNLRNQLEVAPSEGFGD